MSSLNLKNIYKVYPSGVTAVTDFTLDIEDKEFIVFVGPSGCGKSTLLRILAGLVKPDAGTISFDGTDISNLPPEKRRAAMVFQNYALWPHMDVFDNVAFALKAVERPWEEIKTRVPEVLEWVGLAGREKENVMHLSGGEQQRVAIARALARNPEILIFDDSFSALDYKTDKALRSALREKAKDTTCLIVAQRIGTIKNADKIIVLQNGEITDVGTSKELLKYDNWYKFQYLKQLKGDVYE